MNRLRCKHCAGEVPPTVDMPAFVWDAKRTIDMREAALREIDPGKRFCSVRCAALFGVLAYDGGQRRRRRQ